MTATASWLAPDAALVEVPFPNQRVELRYYSDERRSEQLRGGVPAWSWLGATCSAPAGCMRGCDDRPDA